MATTLRAFGVLLVWMLLSAGVRKEDAVIRFPKALLTCLHHEYDSPKIIELPMQARAWAMDLEEDGVLELECRGQMWRVVIE